VLGGLRLLFWRKGVTLGSLGEIVGEIEILYNMASK
jgi:hypothetical protein